MVRSSRYVGFVVLVLGCMLMVGAAALPVSVARSDGRAGVVFRADGCGPAGYAAIRHAESNCRVTAQQRLLVTTTAGLLFVVVGLVLFAGGDPRRSRVEIASGLRRRA